MKKTRALLAIICVAFAFLVTPNSAQASPVSQWADSASSDNEYDETYTANEATGSPNATGCDEINQVWATAKRSDIASITLNYVNYVSPTEIDIYQNNYVNAITNVEVSSDGEVWKSVYTGDATQAVKGTCEAGKNYDDLLVVPAASAGKSAINMVRITIDQTTNGWAEIDAVKLVGNPVREAQQLPPVGVKLYKKSPILLPGSTYAQIKVKWTVTTPKVCKIKAGKLTAVGTGKCKIEAKNSGNNWYKPLNQKISLTVTPGKAPKSQGQAGGN